MCTIYGKYYFLLAKNPPSWNKNCGLVWGLINIFFKTPQKIKNGQKQNRILNRTTIFWGTSIHIVYRYSTSVACFKKSSELAKPNSWFQNMKKKTWYKMYIMQNMKKKTWYKMYIMHKLNWEQNCEHFFISLLWEKKVEK